jgi:DNA-directed RNA polymerase specialized sigma24 family protein
VGFLIDLPRPHFYVGRALSKGGFVVGAYDFRNPESERPQPEPTIPPDQFPVTVWMRIEKVRDSNPSQARAALAELCEAYWRPVYAFIRRKGNDADRAADLTQDFFTFLIEPGALAAVNEGKGKFRSFLMVACTHFLSNQRNYERALKRGGGRAPISIDRLQCEEWLRHEPFHELTADRIFLREWATTLLHRVMAKLQAEVYSRGKNRLFDRIRPTLLGREPCPAYAAIAADLGISESQIKLAVHRYRKRYRVLLREEIARTLDDPAEIEDEITTLIAAVVA